MAKWFGTSRMDDCLTFAKSFCVGNLHERPRPVRPRRELDSSKPVRSPVCPDCMKSMRFVCAELDKQHTSVRHVIFACGCGRTSDQMIADVTLPASHSERA